ncbi:MAG: hypothetical protein PHV20_02595 [Bacteroidales bacterium]|nr:hypothetical protein [Bacteroidales bacterium]
MSETIRVSKIDLKKIREVIVEHNISELDTIYLHPNDLDYIALEYREMYNESIVFPFYLVGIFITMIDKSLICERTIKIERNVSFPKTIFENNQEELYPPFDVVYRCGWCGNIVDYDGSLLDSFTRNEHIRVLEKYKSEIKQIHVNGACCPNGDKT